MPLPILGQPTADDSVDAAVEDTAVDDSFVKAPLEVSPREFLGAIHAGETERVAGYLERQPELARCHDAAGLSALLLAAFQGQDDIVTLLRHHPGLTLSLCEAAAVDDLQRLDELLSDAETDLAQTAADGSTALGLAAFFGHLQAVERLLTAGADSRQVSVNLQRTTALHQAAAHRDGDIALAICRRLLIAGAPVDATQAGGFTPLHQAASRGRDNLVRLFLEHGADRLLESDPGHTAADLGRRQGHHLPSLD